MNKDFKIGLRIDRIEDPTSYYGADYYFDCVLKNIKNGKTTDWIRVIDKVRDNDFCLHAKDVYHEIGPSDPEFWDYVLQYMPRDIDSLRGLGIFEEEDLEDVLEMIENDDYDSEMWEKYKDNKKFVAYGEETAAMILGDGFFESDSLPGLLEDIGIDATTGKWEGEYMWYDIPDEVKVLVAHNNDVNEDEYFLIRENDLFKNVPDYDMYAVLKLKNYDCYTIAAKYNYDWEEIKYKNKVA